MHDDCYYLKDKETILAEREALLSLLQELNSKIELYETKESLRLNAIISQAEKNDVQDEKIVEIEQQIREIKESNKLIREEIKSLKSHLNNGWKTDLIKKMQEENIKNINEIVKQFTTAEVDIYKKRKEANIINWKAELFKLFINATTTGGIIYIIVEYLLKRG